MHCNIRSALPTITISLSASSAYADFQFNLQPAVTPIATEIYDLHNLILLVCLGIFIIVFGVMFYSLYKHRKSVGHQASQFSHNTKLEIVWSIIPFFILVGMAYPTTETILRMKTIENTDMSIKVTGHQWFWEYDYMDAGVSYVSNLSTPRDQIDNKADKTTHYLLEVDQPMVVPTGKKVRLLLTASDVIHSWWIPAFGVKQDAVPGFINEAWFQVDKPGIYRGQCAELCGVGHGFMPIVVEAMPQDQYDVWLKNQKDKLAATAEAATKDYTLEELKTRGEAVFNTRCSACHQANGQGIPGVFPPLVEGAPYANQDTLKRLAERGFAKDGKIVLGPKDKHLDIVMHGIPGTAMQGLGAQMTDLEVAAVVTYERNNWGNKAGDVLQPSEVAAVRKTKG
ncbi:MAG TPA: cytochrome c oxidase subunit II [Methylophilaceae bacterium]|jgi:cytochrome c oxidase subunit 2|nr:cytochrome c oxidase subunit II [Methylophilaceae bacterium]